MKQPLFIILFLINGFCLFGQTSIGCDTVNIVNNHNYRYYTKFDYTFTAEYDSIKADTVLAIHHYWKTKTYYQRFAALVWISDGVMHFRTFSSIPFMEETRTINKKLKEHLIRFFNEQVYSQPINDVKAGNNQDGNFTSLTWNLSGNCWQFGYKESKSNDIIVEWITQLRNLIGTKSRVKMKNDQPVFKYKYDYDNVPKEAKKWFNDMIKIQSTTFTMGRTSWYNITENDSHLLSTIPRRVYGAEFFISDHEVTNDEYREFVQWVTDSIINDQVRKGDSSNYISRTLEPSKIIYAYVEGYDTLSIPIYPDTACWTRDFDNSYNEPMAKLYFQHKAYGNYPVVGVTWFQADAYCLWRSMQLHWIMVKATGSQEYYFPRFRLPTEDEWELAALGTPPEDPYTDREIISDRRIFPWKGHEIRDAKGDYHANYGPVTDANGFELKSFIDDNYFQTAPIRSYLPNRKSLYDMAGNVAEWTMTNPIDDYSNTLNPVPDSMKIDTSDNLHSAIRKMMLWMNFDKTRGYRVDTNNMRDYRLIKMYAMMELNNAFVTIKNPDGRIVKGGSWAHSLIYLECGTRTLFSRNKSSCIVGFRIAMDWVYMGEPRGWYK